MQAIFKSSLWLCIENNIKLNVLLSLRKGTHCCDYFWSSIVDREVKFVIKTKEIKNGTG